jgi:hypothetical protein
VAVEQEQDYGPLPSLDLEVHIDTSASFWFWFGNAVGRQVLLLAIGVPLAVFTDGAWAVIGYLVAVTGVLRLGANVVRSFMIPRGRSYRGWRLGVAALAIGVAPLACLWPHGPVQRMIGITLPLWLSVLAFTLTALYVVVLADWYSRTLAESRIFPADWDLFNSDSVAWLDERIAYLESLLRARRVRSPERREVMRALGFTSWIRFNHPAGGQVADLHRAIEAFKSVAAATPAGSRDEPGVYYDLATALHKRAEVESRDEDIDEALAMYRTIGSSELGKRLTERERDLIQKGTYELLLYRLRLAHIHRLATFPTFDDAVRQEAFQLPPLDDAALQEALNELTAVAAHDKSDRDRARASFLSAIAEFHMLAISQVNMRQLGMHLLGKTEESASKGAAMGHLDQAIEAMRGADALMETDNPNKPFGCVSLAYLLASRAISQSTEYLPADGADQDREDAKHYLLLAIADPALARLRTTMQGEGTVLRLLQAATICVDLELGRREWQEASRIGRLAVGELESLVRTAIFRRSREAALQVSRGLHSKVGYAMAMGADGQQDALLAAIQMIESGRAVLLREALGRSELSEQADRLRAAGNAGLAAEVAAALSRVTELEAIELSTHDAQGVATLRANDKVGRPLRDAISAAQTDIARLRPRIDAALGTDDSRSAQDHIATPAGAPLCYLLHARYVLEAMLDVPQLRHLGTGPDLPGLALIVSAAPSAEQAVRVQAVPLPGVTGAAIRGWHDRWQGSHSRPTLRTGDLVQLGRLFNELGKSVIEPAFSAAGRPARLTLLPDGLLSMLPLHAATVLDSNGVPRALCQHVVVNYAPTTAVLRSCQDEAGDINQPQAARIPERFLGIAASAGELRGASPELRAAASYFGKAEIIDDGRQGQQRVLTALTANAPATAPSVLHFACHARAEVYDPLSSVIEVAPGPEGQVRLADLLAVGLGNTRLAVLSACETGALGSVDPDQFVSLATGFVQIGAAGVIATMSPVADPVALALTMRFYQEWAALPADPAMALSAAQRWLATADPAALAAVLDDAYPQLSPMDLAQYTHPAHWASFFFLGA